MRLLCACELGDAFSRLFQLQENDAHGFESPDMTQLLHGELLATHCVVVYANCIIVETQNDVCCQL